VVHTLTSYNSTSGKNFRKLFLPDRKRKKQTVDKPFILQKMPYIAPMLESKKHSYRIVGGAGGIIFSARRRQKRKTLYQQSEKSS